MLELCRYKLHFEGCESATGGSSDATRRASKHKNLQPTVRRVHWNRRLPGSSQHSQLTVTWPLGRLNEDLCSRRPMLRARFFCILPVLFRGCYRSSSSVFFAQSQRKDMKDKERPQRQPTCPPNIRAGSATTCCSASTLTVATVSDAANSNMKVA